MDQLLSSLKELSAGFQPLGVFLLAAFLAYILTPVFRKLSFWSGFVDQPGRLKIHQQPMPLFGGCAICLAFLLSFWFFFVLWDIPNEAFFENGIWQLVLAGSIILGAGLLDDKQALSPYFKLPVQMGVALIVIRAGIQLRFFGQPYLDVPLTVLWLVGMVNALNLQDGLDGLAAGLSIISLGFFSWIGFLKGDIFLALSALALLGSCLGFLRYNFHPAKIFLGDNGSQFLGFCLGVFALVVSDLSPRSFNYLAAPVIILAVPLFGTILAILRRFLNRRPLLDGDRDHAYDKLCRRGFTQPQAVGILYLIGLGLGFPALFFLEGTVLTNTLLFLGLLIFLLLLINRLKLLDYTGER